MVDDVLTQGRTSYACYKRLNEIYPDAEIRLFCLVRAQGLIPEIDSFRDPSFGTITYYQQSDKSEEKTKAGKNM